MDTTPAEVFALLIADLGGQAAVARFLGVTAQAVNQWCKAGKPPADRVVDLVVEARRRGAYYTEAQLRPDVFKPPVPRKGILR
jgi:DNA-binding transcriptional regulator YdaS (Cro superfamily)